MPQPIVNIIIDAGLDYENMESIDNTPDNVKKIKQSFRKKWEEKAITDEEICNDLFDYNGAPDWIKEAIEQERSAIPPMAT